MAKFLINVEIVVNVGNGYLGQTPIECAETIANDYLVLAQRKSIGAEYAGVVSIEKLLAD